MKAVKQMFVSDDNSISNTLDKRLIFEKELSFDEDGNDYSSSCDLQSTSSPSSLTHPGNPLLSVNEFKLKGFKIRGVNTIPLDVLTKAKLGKARIEGKVTRNVVLRDVNKLTASNRLAGGSVGDNNSTGMSRTSSNRFSDFDSLPSFSIISSTSGVSTSSSVTPPWLPHNALKPVELTKSVRFNNPIEKTIMLKRLKLLADPTNMFMTIKRQDAVRHRFEGFINENKM